MKLPQVDADGLFIGMKDIALYSHHDELSQPVEVVDEALGKARAPANIQYGIPYDCTTIPMPEFDPIKDEVYLIRDQMRWRVVVDGKATKIFKAKKEKLFAYFDECRSNALNILNGIASRAYRSGGADGLTISSECDRVSTELLNMKALPNIVMCGDIDRLTLELHNCITSCILTSPAPVVKALATAKLLDAFTVD